MSNNRYLYTIVRKLSDGSKLCAQVPSSKLTHESLRAAVRIAFGNLASTTYVTISSEDGRWHGLQYTVYRGGRVRRQRNDW